MEDNPALDLLGQWEEARPAFDLAAHYPAEMAVPAVARLVELCSGLDRHQIHLNERPKAEDDRYVYGETPIPVMYRLLRRWGVGPQDVFYDLGCGCGLPVLTAALLVRKAVGVELVPGPVEFGRRAAAVLGLSNTEFHVGDLLQTDLRDATFVYSATTVFPGPLRAQLADHLRSTRKGTRILTVTHQLKAKGILPVTQVPMFFSWAEDGEGFPFQFFLHVRQ